MLYLIQTNQQSKVRFTNNGRKISRFGRNLLPHHHARGDRNGRHTRTEVHGGAIGRLVRIVRNVLGRVDGAFGKLSPLAPKGKTRLTI